ncbi:MAG: hypothetical protein R2694_09675 [Ilumatobacteraceae bacterium]
MPRSMLPAQRRRTTPSGSMMNVSGTWATPNATLMEPSSSVSTGHDATAGVERRRTSVTSSLYCSTVYSSAAGDPQQVLLLGERHQFRVLRPARDTRG